jgi:hypothetical protein
MHRSGTSAMTGAMAKLGAALPRGLMPAARDNERGFFESAPIAAWHDDILAASGSSWHDWRRFEPPWLAAPPASLKADATRLLDEEFGAAPLLVLKDPRICRFLPFWLCVLGEAGVTPRAVIPFRSPFEVAASLRTRDGFSLEKGLLLWLRHVLGAERETRGLPRAFVAMDDFLANWRKCSRRVAREIGIVWPNLTRDSSARIDHFLSRDLKHHNIGTDAPGAATAWATRAQEALLILSRNPRSKLARAALDEVAGAFEQACALMGPEIGRLEGAAAARRAEIDNIAAERDALLEARESAGATPLERIAVLRARTDDVRLKLERIRDSLAAGGD